MDTYINKPKRSPGLAPQQPKSTQVPAPQQMKPTPAPAPQPMKAPQVPAPQQAYGSPRPRPAPTAAPTQEDIAKRAYEIYVQKGCPEGQSEENWKQAERELKR